ncbi:hypothetical protein ACWGLF_18820 [Streptomyces puniciscabiei]
MDEMPPVVVYPPAEDGGRRVRVGAHFVGMAYSLLDVAEFLERAGLEGVEPEDVAAADWVEWRGSGPDAWGR